MTIPTPRRQPHHHRARPRPAEVRAALALFAPVEAAPPPARRGRPHETDERDQADNLDPGRGHGLGNRNQRRGTAVEGVNDGRGAMAVLRDQGYYPLRLDQRFGARYDLVAVRLAGGGGGRPRVRLVEVKRRKQLATALTAVRAAVDKQRADPAGPRLPADVTREVWLYVDRQGFVLRTVLCPHGGLTVQAPALTGRVAERLAAWAAAHPCEVCMP